MEKGNRQDVDCTSLALSLKNTHKVQLLDCDVEEPNDYIFMKPEFMHQETVSIPVPEVDKEKCDHCGKCAEVCAYKAIAVWGKQVMIFAQLCHGCGACSYICPHKAIKEVPRAIGVIESGYVEGIDFVYGKS